MASVGRHLRRAWERPFGRAVSSRPGGWLFVNVVPHVDRPLQRLSRGRLSVALGQPILVLETVGRKSGQRRRSPLIYLRDGDDLFLIGSRGGDTRHPAWYHNLKANPAVTVVLRGETLRFRAHEAEGEERERLWAKAARFYDGYARYQGRAGARRIPVVVLTPEA